MNIIERLEKLRNDHKKSYTALDKALSEFENSDILAENRDLQKEIEKLSLLSSNMRKELKELNEKNSQLKEALYEQIANEKTNILKLSRNKLETLFRNSENEQENRLATLELNCKNRLSKYKKSIDEKHNKEYNKISATLQSAITEIESIIIDVRKKEIEELKKIRESADEQYRQLQDTGIDEETVKKRIRQNKIEMKIGLGLINRAGIVLILLGIGALAQYSYSRFFNNYHKGSFFFLIGLLLSAGGEYTFRKRMQSFSSGLTGGGIAALYGALFYSHFVLEIIGLVPALALAAVIALSSVLLTLRYNSQIIGIVTLIGGFLPFFSYSFGFEFTETTRHGAMLYLLVLNTVLLAISYIKIWRPVIFISYFMNIPCLLYLVFNYDSFTSAVIYLVIAFIVYQSVILLKPLRHKTAPNVAEIALMVLHSFVISLSVFLLFELNDYDGYKGLIALCFTVVFIAEAVLLHFFFSKDHIFTVLIFGAALTFSVLAIPFQFGISWALFGWIIQAVFLIIAGNRYNYPPVEKMGQVIGALTALFFLLYNLVPYYESGIHSSNFSFKFISLAAASILVMAYYKNLSNRQTDYKIIKTADIFSFCNLGIVWLLILTLVPLHTKALAQAEIPLYFYGRSELISFFVMIALTTAHLAFGFYMLIPQLFKGKAYKYLPFVSWSIAAIIIAVANFTIPLGITEKNSTSLHGLAFMILIIYNIIFIAVIAYCAIKILKSLYTSLELFPLITAFWILTATVATLVVQFDLSFNSIILTGSLLILSLLFITYGFIKRYRLIRVMGLIIVISTLAKFFIMDLSNLKLEYKIVSYFSYGVILIAISFIYQKLKQAVDKI